MKTTCFAIKGITYPTAMIMLFSEYFVIFVFSAGIKGFSANQNNVLKWCLNRPQQAKHMTDLTELAGLTGGTEVYKPL